MRCFYVCLRYNDLILFLGEVCREKEGRTVCTWEQKHLVLTEDDFKFRDDDVRPEVKKADVPDYTRPIHPARYTVKHPALPEVNIP